jgi:hypothetical protein
VLAGLFATGILGAQDLIPRAYIIAPTGSNAVILSASFNDGAVFTDATLPIEDFKGKFSTPVFSYYHAYSLLGRFANVTVSLPYAVGNFSATVGGVHEQVYRSGLADARVRFAVNLLGGPAMRPKEFQKWRERRIIGVSLTAVVPLGQYDPARVINPGTNRWALKPEVGFTRRWGKWMADWYVGAWFYSDNSKYFPGNADRGQRPIVTGEGHFGYYFKPFLWASFDANFWSGGRSSINGADKSDTQRNSRMGATVSIPIRKHQSLKFSYSGGAYITIGGAYKSLSAAWQYSWLTPK